MALTVGRDGGPVSQINVTPMADVIIVLLVVMMLAVPLLDRESGLRLPGAPHARPDPRNDGGLRLVLRANASLWLGPQAFPSRDTLREALRERLDARREGQRVVWLLADQDVAYREVDAAMLLCREAGAEQVALVADPAQSPS